MRKLLVPLALFALLITACGDGDAGGPTGFGAGDSMTNGINVTGQGRVYGTPDTLTLRLGVSVLRSTVDAATTEAAAQAQAIIAALEAGGVARTDIQTANYSIYPEYDYSGSTQRLTGYRVSNDLTVKIRDLSAAGALIDAATAAGGDATVVQNLAFSIEDNTALLEMARTAAWNDAEAKAEQLAQLAGVSLRSAISITETINYNTPPIYYARDMAGGEQAATPIEAGEQEVTVVVQVTFSIGF
jgi:uncharacterized protein YggE